MSTIRDLEAELKRDVEHTVLQDLGYAEYAIYPPEQALPLNPRPQIRQLDAANFKDARAIESLIDPNTETRPTNIYEVKISRTYPRSQLVRYGRWRLVWDEEPLVDIFASLLGLVQKDAEWVLYLGVIRL